MDKLDVGTAFNHFGIATQDVSITLFTISCSEIFKRTETVTVDLVTFLFLIYLQIYNTVEKIRANGGVIVREPGPFTEGGTNIFAFVKDPNGYSFELLQRPPTPEPLCQVCINVFDIDRSIEFYNKVCLLSY